MGNHTSVRARGRSSGASSGAAIARAQAEVRAAGLEYGAAFKALAAFNKAHETEWGGGGSLHPEFGGLVDRLNAASARERAAREQVRQLSEAPRERAAWKEAIPSLRASVGRARAAPEHVMRAPRSETHLHDAKALREEETRLRPEIQRLRSELQPH